MNRVRLGLGLAGGAATLFGVALVVAPGIARTGPVGELSTRLADVDSTSVMLAAGLLAVALTVVLVRGTSTHEPFEPPVPETDAARHRRPRDAESTGKRRRSGTGERRATEQERRRSEAGGGPEGNGYGWLGSVEYGIERGSTPTDRDIERGSTPTDRDIERAIEAGGEPFEGLVDHLAREAAWSYAAATGCGVEQARAVVERGEWTGDRLATGVLGGSVPVSAAVRLWLGPVSERRRRVERTITAIERIGR